MSESYISKTSGIRAKDKIGYAMGDVGSLLVFGLVQSVLQKYYTDILGIGYTDNVLNTANITDSILKRMYADSVLIPAVLFLLVFAILRFIYPLGKKRIAELQVQKEEALRKMMH